MSWQPVDHYDSNTLGSGCLLCRHGEVRQTANGPEPILSTGVDTFDGVPEICATCIGEAARMLGFHSKVEFDTEVALREKAEADHDELSVMLDEKTATIRTLTAELALALNPPAPTEKPTPVRQQRVKANS